METINKHKSTAEIDVAIARLAHLRETVDGLPDNLPGDLWQDGDCLRLHLPYSINALREMRQMLGSGWRFDHSYFYAPAGTMNVYYVNQQSGVKMLVTLQTTMEGATCHRIQVGEKVQPIYQVVCS